MFKSNRDEILRNLSDLDGIVKLKLFLLKNFFKNKRNIEIVKNLIKKLNIQNLKRQIKRKIEQYKRYVYWKFKKISRSEAKTLTENLGGKVLGSVSKKLNILVVGDSKPMKKKIESERT